MSKRHRRAIHLTNLSRQWCRQVERIVNAEMVRLIYSLPADAYCKDPGLGAQSLWREMLRIDNLPPRPIAKLTLSDDLIRSIRRSIYSTSRGVATQVPSADCRVT